MPHVNESTYSVHQSKKIDFSLREKNRPQKALNYVIAYVTSHVYGSSYLVVCGVFLVVQFNETFFHFVLDNIEDPPADDSNDLVSDGLIGMLLAFNLHFKGKPLKRNTLTNTLN